MNLSSYVLPNQIDVAGRAFVDSNATPKVQAIGQANPTSTLGAKNAASTLGVETMGRGR